MTRGTVRRLCGMAIVAVLLLAATAAAQQEITLTVIAHLGQDHIYQDIVDHFLPNYPGVNVEYVHVGGWGPTLEKIAVMHVAGTPPDLFLLSDGPDTLPLAKQFGRDMTEFWVRDNLDASDWFPGSIDTVIIDGKLVGLPHHINPELFFYNLQVFDNLGLQHPPASYDEGAWTWDMIAEMGQKMTQDTDGDGTPDTWGFVGGYSRIWLELLEQYGASFSENGRLALSSEKAQAALSFIQDNNYQQGGWWYTGSDRSSSWFFEEHRAGFYPSGYWIMGGSRQPHLLPFNLMPKPSVNPERIPGGGSGAPTSQLGTHFWAVSRDSQHPELAWELAKFLAGEHHQNAVVARHWFPAHRDAVLGEIFPTVKPSVNQTLLFQTAMIASPTQQDWALAPREAQNLVNAALNQIAAGEKHPSAAIREIESAVNAILLEDSGS